MAVSRAVAPIETSSLSKNFRQQCLMLAREQDGAESRKGDKWNIPTPPTEDDNHRGRSRVAMARTNKERVQAPSPKDELAESTTTLHARSLFPRLGLLVAEDSPSAHQSAHPVTAGVHRHCASQTPLPLEKLLCVEEGIADQQRAQLQHQRERFSALEVNGRQQSRGARPNGLVRPADREMGRSLDDINPWATSTPQDCTHSSGTSLWCPPRARTLDILEVGAPQRAQGGSTPRGGKYLSSSDDGPCPSPEAIACALAAKGKMRWRDPECFGDSSGASGMQSPPNRRVTFDGDMRRPPPSVRRSNFIKLFPRLGEDMLDSIWQGAPLTAPQDVNQQQQQPLENNQRSSQIESLIKMDNFPHHLSLDSHLSQAPSVTNAEQVWADTGKGLALRGQKPTQRMRRGALGIGQGREEPVQEGHVNIGYDVIPNLSSTSGV